MSAEEPKSVSSPWTFSAKFIAPVLWFVFGGYFVFTGLTGHPLSRGHASAPVAKWLLIAGWAVGGLVALKTSAGLKRVRMDGQGLVVSDYLSEIRVPFDEIRSVEENRWKKGRPVTITLGRPSLYGNKFTFLPWPLVKGFHEHPLVGELRRRAAYPA
jgi:hypothetical protein